MPRADHEAQRSEARLEGIILRDSANALYEVPALVIERYRVTPDRAAELAVDAAALGGAGGGAWWTVAGAIFGPLPPC